MDGTIISATPQSSTEREVIDASTVEQIERAVERLSADELAEFRAWFAA
ncbi:MAG: hypothetical protein U0835_12140 [Isosphaeraceae bacterium]